MKRGPLKEQVPETALGSVPALERALDLLEHLREAAEGLTIAEISAALDLPKNAVFRITHTLAARGYLARDEASRRFRLTTKLLTVASPRVHDISLVGAALAAMKRLRDETRETVQIGVLTEIEGVVIEKVDGLHPVRIAVDLGLRFPLHNNAPGKVLLANRSRADRDALIGRFELVASTSRTITDPAELRLECDRVVAAGYATDRAEADEGIHCVAAPVFARPGELAATVWVSAPSRRMPRDTFAAIGVRVKRAAADITRAIEG
jgi:DNA-binding IclR family transcriptional regulator